MPRPKPSPSRSRVTQTAQAAAAARRKDARTMGGLPSVRDSLAYGEKRRGWLAEMDALDPVVVEVLRAAGYSWARVSAALGGRPTAVTLAKTYGSVEG